MAAPETNVGEDVVESGASEYERAGRQTNRTMTSATDGETSNLTWDVTSSLTESDGQGGHTVYAYDASGQRVVQARVADANGVGTATGYVASGQVDDPTTAPTSTGDLTAARHYTFPGSTVAIRTDDGNLALMLGDEQGSTNVMMPVTVQTDGAAIPGNLASATLADAGAVTRTAYTPYGALRGADNLAVDRGWLGQVEDRVVGTGASSTGTGLTYLNARYYDPVLSRFLSPDPLMDPGDPKTLDPYRYADNNPVVFTDASGLAACYGLSAANEKTCLASYYKGTGYKPPTPGSHLVPPPKPKVPEESKKPKTSNGIPLFDPWTPSDYPTEGDLQMPPPIISSLQESPDKPWRTDWNIFVKSYEDGRYQILETYLGGSTTELDRKRRYWAGRPGGFDLDLARHQVQVYNSLFARKVGYEYASGLDLEALGDDDIWLQTHKLYEEQNQLEARVLIGGAVQGTNKVIKETVEQVLTHGPKAKGLG